MAKNNRKERKKRHAKRHANNIIVISTMHRKYSTPQLHIAKDKEGKPTLSKPWYVYYYFENPLTGKKDRQPFKIYEGINRIKTIKGRKDFGKQLLADLTHALVNGFTPFQETEQEKQSKKRTIIKALEYAFEEKKPDWKPKTLEDIEGRKNNFIKWLKDNHYQQLLITELDRKLLSSFLNHIAKKTSNRNANNFKSAISSLLTKLVDDGLLEQNVLLNMKKRPTKPTKHKAFTQEELTKIKEYLLQNDVNLYYFMCFVGFGFLRNVEVCRLRNKSFDLKNWTMSVETKTDTFETIRVIETLKPIVTEMGITGKGNLLVFTPEGKPSQWDNIERDRVGYFGKRFRRVKSALGLDEDHTIYSMRHTFAVNIYNGHIKNGLTDKEAILKMLPVTRHKNESGLRNYLRSVNAFIANDYSNNITIEF